MVNNTFTVTGFVSYLKKLVDGDFNIQSIYIKGEISKVTVSPNGHCYFELKDAGSSISCVCFRSSFARCKDHIKTGNKVRCFGGATVYTASSKLQFNVIECLSDGIGDLYQQFELLKKKLAEKGLFNAEHKKPVPEYPLNFAVIVGKDSAAYTDIVATFKRRWPIAKVDFYFSLVQGKDAHLNIIQNLLYADSRGYDAIILARGGGSIEDLFCFNEEALAEVIYDLNTFIVTGVGHEIDTTIVDYVADLRANTPTAAVELITPDIFDLKEDIANTDDYLTKLINIHINDLKHKLLEYDKTFTSFDSIISRYKDYIDKTSLRIDYNFKEKITENENILKYLKTRMSNNLRIKTDSSLYDSKNLYIRLENSFKYKIDSSKKQVNRLDILLDAFSPLQVLDRGYIIASANGQIIKSIDKINIGDDLNLQFHDGSIKVSVKEKING